MLYTRLIKTTGTLIVAMKEMLKNDVFNFLVLLIVILIGWSYILTQLFRSYLFEYRTVFVTITTLIKSVLGGVEFVDNIGNIIQETVGNILLAIFSLVALILLINLLIAMMGNTYDQIQEAAIHHWSYSKAQSLIYFEKSHWVPPFNIFSEAVMLVIWVSNTLTCGFVSKTTGVSDDYSMNKLPKVFGKLKPTTNGDDADIYKFSSDLKKLIIYPEAIQASWGTNLEDEDNEEFSDESSSTESLVTI